MRWKTVCLILACSGLIFCAASQKKQMEAREKDPQYQYNLGLFYLNNNSVDDAVKSLTKAIAFNSRHYLAWNALGLAHLMKGSFPEAVLAFQKCLEISPQFTEARNNLGNAYQELRSLDKAEEEYKTALRDSNYASRELLYYNLARLYFTQEKFDLALDNANRAIQFKGRFGMAYNLKGLILEKQNNLPEAVTAYEQAVRIVPDDTTFGLNLAMAYFKNNEFEKAREVFEKVRPKVMDAETRASIDLYLKTIREKK